jgi:hypothetical protein
MVREVERDNNFDPLDMAIKVVTSAEPISKITTIDELLDDERALAEMVAAVAGGASIKSVEMTLGLEPGMLVQWLKYGKEEREGPFRALYLFYRKAASGARMAAEASLLTKNPSEWLKTNDVEVQLEAGSDKNILLGSVSDGPTFLDVEEPKENDRGDGASTSQ